MCWHIKCKCSKIFLFSLFGHKIHGQNRLENCTQQVFRNVNHAWVCLHVDIKMAIQLVSGAAGVWFNLVPRALFLPLPHLKGKGGLGTSLQIKKEDNYDTSSCSSGLKENINWRKIRKCRNQLQQAKPYTVISRIDCLVVKLYWKEI